MDKHASLNSAVKHHIATTSAINFSDVLLGYDEKIIVDGVTAQIRKGCITTIIGPNGAGKSTLLKAFARLLRLRGGTIQVMDKDLVNLSQKDLARYVSMLLQQNVCPDDMTVERLVMMGRTPHQRWFESATEDDTIAVKEAMSLAHVEEMAHKHMFQLSGGERQRVWLAMALAQKTDILLLDEPTTYLDIAYQIDVLECIKDINETQKLTIVMVLHDLNQAFKYSDELLVMQDGKLVLQGGCRQIARREFLRSIYHIDAEILEIDGSPYVIARQLVPHNTEQVKGYEEQL